MSLRSSLPLALSLLLGCAGASGLDFEDRGDLTPAAQDANSRLELEQTAPVLSLLPGDTRELAVRYRAASGIPVAGMEVEFVLAGMTAGASVSPSRAPTDASGVARTKLRVGNTMGMLQVRARAPGADPAYVDVIIGSALPAKLRASVDYGGARDLSSYTITAIPNVTCATALQGGMSGLVVHRIERQEDAVDLTLAPGASVAVLAWGSDTTGAPLARGCRDIKAPTTTSQSEADVALEVVLTDLAQRLEGTLPVEVAVNVAGPVKRLGETVQTAVQRVIMPSGRYGLFAEAEFYLDAITEWMRGQELPVAGLEMARANSSLASSLAPALANAGRGPMSLATRLSGQLGERGASVVFAGSLEGAARLTITSAGAQGGGDGVAVLTLDSMPNAVLSARFEPQRANVMIDSLRIELGLGRYGRALLAAMQTETGSTLRAELESSAGCSEVLVPWSELQLVGICDASCARAACRLAVDKLLASVDATYVELDAGGSAITLMGRAPTHDRTEDGKVDDLGPGKLSGVWAQGTTVAAELREPTRNALTF